MYSIIKTQTRTSTHIPFYFEKHIVPTEYRNYFNDKFILTKKFLSSDTVYSDDNLTVTKTTTWSSRNAFMEFAGDLYCYSTVIEPSREYDIENEITSDIEIKGN